METNLSQCAACIPFLLMFIDLARPLRSDEPILEIEISECER